MGGFRVVLCENLIRPAGVGFVPSPKQPSALLRTRMQADARKLKGDALGSLTASSSRVLS